jgi:hypothetical protein
MMSQIPCPSAEFNIIEDETGDILQNTQAFT